MAARASVFEFWDYKAYLVRALDSSQDPAQGTQTALAKAINCQPAYLSRVFRGSAHLSADQAFLASKHLGHTAEERRYFLLLLQMNRAVSPEIENYYRSELQAIRSARLELKRRLPVRQPLEAEQQAIYYGHWLHAAVHMALTIPTLNQPRKIAEHLRVSVKSVVDSLDFLCSIGLAKEKNGTFLPTEQQMHLDAGSPMINRHHTNCRLAAIRQLESPIPDGFHYSSIVSISEGDRYEVQRILTEAIERIREVVRESPAEKIACYSLDFFALGT